MKYEIHLATLLAACLTGTSLAARAEGAPLRMEVHSSPLDHLPGFAGTEISHEPPEGEMLKADAAIESVIGYRVLPNGNVVTECAQVGMPSLQGAVIGRRAAKEGHR